MEPQVLLPDQPVIKPNHTLGECTGVLVLTYNNTSYIRDTLNAVKSKEDYWNISMHLEITFTKS